MSQRILDCAGEEIAVGSRVAFEDGDGPGVVAVITEWDGDWDDELQRPVLIAPRVRVALDALPDHDWVIITREVTNFSWADYPDGPAVRVFEADDLRVLPA